MSLPAIDVHDLAGHPGASRQVALTGTIDGLGTELARIPEEAPVRADLVLESVVEGIYVHGVVRGSWSLRCARCLTEFDGAFEVAVHDLFVPEPEADTDDYRLDLELGIDADQLARDAIGVEMPFSPLCRPDCAGLCEVCGGNRNLGECPGHETVDPRFAVLSQLLPELSDDDR